MKKVGILTHCIANNFGANLQALSTACYLRQHGFIPVFFYWDDYLKQRSRKLNEQQLEIHRLFLKKHGFEVSEPCRTTCDFKKVIEKNNISNIIVGSDAVLTVSSWLDRISISRKGIRFNKIAEDKKFPNPFWIPFAKLIPYCHFYYLSPSCQSSNYKFISQSVLNKMRTQMEHFDYISARDTCTKEMMEYVMKTNNPIPITPDPVWGFVSNFKEIPNKDYILAKYGIQGDYMLASFYKGSAVSPIWLDGIRSLARQDGIELYSLPMPQGHFNSNLPQIELPVDPIDWFALIKYSKGYIGNNMHPIIVSMVNRVPFFSIDQHGKKIMRFHFEKTSKVHDLLKRFNLLDFRIKQPLAESLPPSEVYWKLRNFPINLIDTVAKKMENDYKAMMQEICEMFNKVD